MKRRSWLIALILLQLMSVSAQGHWDIGDPAKWVQMPDPEPTAIDVNATPSEFGAYMIADDFLCEEVGYIRKIHIWGAWRNDYLPFGDDPTGVHFMVGIHADIPASQSPTGYSMPGDPLWYANVYPSRYTVRRYDSGLEAGWLDPPATYWPGIDTDLWQYNFWFNEGAAFQQQGAPGQPIVYWLVVQAFPDDSQALFGWRSSTDHWNDNTTWATGYEPYNGYWDELRYPSGHPSAGDSIDLAFVIGDETVEDWGDAPEPYPTLYADGGANHTVVPGFLMGDQIDGDANGMPDPDALGDDISCADDEDGVLFWAPLVQGSPSYVAIDMTEATVGGYVDAWIDFGRDGSWVEPWDRIAESHWVEPGVITKLHFSVPLDSDPGPTFGRFRLSSMGGLSYIGWAPDGEVEDHAVEIQGGEGWKWRQEPHLGCLGIDVNATAPYLLADDWLCESPGRVDEITIWGSWLGDMLPQGDPRMAKFTLSIHEDVPVEESPTGYSTPGEVLWVRDFLPDDYAVDVWAEGIAEGWLDPPQTFAFPADTTCWKYTFPVPFDEAFHQVGTPGSPVIYWLDVQATPLDDPDARFGWKTTEFNWNDDAVWGSGEEPYYGNWGELVYPEGHSWHGESIDLAFELRSSYGTAIPDEQTPSASGLTLSVPNPFQREGIVSFSLPEPCRASVRVYDASGKLVSVLADGPHAAGRHTVTWRGRDDRGNELGSGVYFLLLEAGETTTRRKMVMVR
ncbi:MAG: T9SS type A sorting domain-containing protein [Candidatus Eisenbacteria bacterium]|nr:T9SS type A sorting domain-containing protein [Candidatus Eisenbacteria bacterium]